jgi:outer membrane protein OmpA-like peptidoglycan-associated protein
MKINIPILGFLALIISSSYSFTQKNKAFEKEVLKMTFERNQSNDPINEIGGVDALDYGVSSPSERKADLFSTEAGGDVKVPENIFGKEEPIKDIGGSQYLGLILYKPGKLANERSYVTIPLGRGKEQITLKKNLNYCVEFSISLAESSKFGINNIAALFSKDDFGSNNTSAIYNSTDRLVKSQNNKVFSGFYGWEQVCNIYTAKGDERFITIGNFDKNETTKFEAVKKPKDSDLESISQAYYYVDNVNITLIDKEEDCKCYNNAPKKIEESFSNLIYSKTPELTDKMTTAEKVAEQVAYFRFGKATFSENCKEAMNFVLNELTTNPQFRIEIQGHCDAKELKVGEGIDEYYQMDRKRVAAVAKYFEEQGIDPTRIDKTYKSETTQSSEVEEDDEDEVKDAKNRRINFILK